MMKDEMDLGWLSRAIHAHAESRRKYCGGWGGSEGGWYGLRREGVGGVASMAA